MNHILHSVVLAHIDLDAARGHFRALDSMDTDGMDGATYCAWAREHEAAWWHLLSLQDKIRNMEA